MGNASKGRGSRVYDLGPGGKHAQTNMRTISGKKVARHQPHIVRSDQKNLCLSEKLILESTGLTQIIWQIDVIDLLRCISAYGSDTPRKIPSHRAKSCKGADVEKCNRLKDIKK